MYLYFFEMLPLKKNYLKNRTAIQSKELIDLNKVIKLIQKCFFPIIAGCLFIFDCFRKVETHG